MNRTRVLIIEEHENVRAALLARLDRHHDLAVKGVAAPPCGDFEDVLTFEPDVVLLEVKRDDGRGIDICRGIIRARPSTRVVVLTSYSDELEKSEVEAMGVTYLLKDLDIHDLVTRIKEPRAKHALREVDR